MKQATVYDEQGRVLGQYSASSDQALMANLQGLRWIQGRVPDNHYIKHGQAIAMPPCPDTQHLCHQWNYSSECWEFDADKTARHLRTLRDNDLKTIDQINPVWFSSLTAQQVSELQAYRQALLDVPQQATFPSQVEWPAKPHWL